MPNPIMKFFTYEHLTHMRSRNISEKCAKLARDIEVDVEDSAEKSAGLRKLLEAKDCFVRAALP